MPRGGGDLDVVFVVYLVAISVVLVDTCGCCDLIIHGDLLMSRKYRIMYVCRFGRLGMMVI